MCVCLAGEVESEREITSSFYSETWPMLEPGPCTYMHNRSLARKREGGAERETEGDKERTEIKIKWKLFQ